MRGIVLGNSYRLFTPFLGFHPPTRQRKAIFGSSPSERILQIIQKPGPEIRHDFHLLAVLD